MRSDVIAEGRHFSIWVVRDNLTNEGALLVEATLVSMLNPAGNVAPGMARQEIPPLELDEAMLAAAAAPLPWTVDTGARELTS